MIVLALATLIALPLGDDNSKNLLENLAPTVHSTYTNKGRLRSFAELVKDLFVILTSAPIAPEAKGI